MNLLTGQKGVTLISLVITIIVMLILATVAIGLSVWTEELFSKANEAATETNEKTQEELEILSGLEETLKYYDNSLFKCDNNRDDTAYGVTVSNKENLPFFHIDGIVTHQGHLLAGVGPKLEAGEYTIAVYGRENLLCFYIQTKTEEVDWLTLPEGNYLNLNETYSFTLQEDSLIRIGITLGEVGTVHNNDEYKIDLYKVE